MIRKILPLLLVVALAALAYFILGEGSRPELSGIGLTVGEIAGDAKVIQGAVGGPAPTVDPSAATAGPDATKRTEVDADAKGDAKAPRTLRARVVKKEDQSPVPGAVVRFLDPDFKWEAITPAQRLRWGEVSHDRELHYQAFGGQTTADRDGWVDVPIGQWGCRCMARSGDLYGQEDFNVNNVAPSGGRLIELEPDLELRVRVVDQHQKPVAGVPVAVETSIHWAQMPQPYKQLHAVGKSTAPDGLLVVRHLQQRRKGWNWKATAQQKRGLRLVLNVAGSDAEGVELDPANPPTETVVLVMPPAGSLAVRLLDVEGKPVTESATVSLTVVDPTRPKQDQQHFFMGFGGGTHRSLIDGEALFEHVALGKQFSVHCWVRQDSVKQTVAGPTRHGQRVPVALRLTNLGHILVGRALDREGQPLAGHFLSGRVSPIDKKSSHHVAAKTDDQGRFRLFLGKQMASQTLGPMTLSASTQQHRRNSTDSATTAALGALPAGEYDLGDVVFEPEPLIVAGVVIDEQGNPVAKARGYVQEHRVTQRQGKAVESWSHLRMSNMTTDESGRFEIRGEVAPGRFRLRVNAPGYVARDPVEFTLGAAALELSLRHGGSLRVTVRVDPGIPASALQVHLRQPDAVAVEATEGGSRPSRSQGIAGQLIEQKDGALAYQWRGVEPGTYAVEVKAKTHEAPLLPPPAVQLAGDLVTREEIDLRGVLRTFAVTILDPEGNQLKGNPGGGVFIRPDAPSGSLLQVRAAKGVAKIITPARFVNVLVMVKGYRPQSIEALSQDIEVRLAGPITVLLELNNGSAIPAGYIMRLRIQPKDLGAPFDQRYSSTRGGNPFAFNYSSMSHEVSQASEVMTLESPMVNWGGGGGGTLANLALKQSSITLKAGKGSFETAAAGRFTITATIAKASKSRRRARTRAQSVQLDPAQIDVLDAGNQSFKLTVNAKSLAAALAKIAEAANKSSETSKPR